MPNTAHHTLPPPCACLLAAAVSCAAHSQTDPPPIPFPNPYPSGHGDGAAAAPAPPAAAVVRCEWPPCASGAWPAVASAAAHGLRLVAVDCSSPTARSACVQVTPMKFHVAGTMAAAGLAAERGWAINIGGGMHHASSNEGGGCVRQRGPVCALGWWQGVRVAA